MDNLHLNFLGTRKIIQTEKKKNINLIYVRNYIQIDVKKNKQVLIYKILTSFSLNKIIMKSGSNI